MVLLRIFFAAAANVDADAVILIDGLVRPARSRTTFLAEVEGNFAAPSGVGAFSVELLVLAVTGVVPREQTLFLVGGAGGVGGTKTKRRRPRTSPTDGSCSAVIVVIIASPSPPHLSR